MAIVIKKRVSLEYLGEDYKQAYLVFKSIPVIDFVKIQDELKTFEDNADGSVNYILDLLKKYFVEGKFPNEEKQLEDVKTEDLDGLDPQTCIKCFQLFTGQVTDPLVEKPLTNISPTAE